MGRRRCVLCVWFHSSLVHMLRVGEGAALCSKLLGHTKARNAMQHYFWSLMFDDGGEDEVALGPTSNRGIPLAEMQRKHSAGGLGPHEGIFVRFPVPMSWAGYWEGESVRAPPPPPKG